MSDTTGAMTTAYSPDCRRGSVLIALCRLPAVVGSLGLLLVLLTPLGRWEPVAMLAWLGAGFALCCKAVERRALRWFGRVRPCSPGEREVLDGPWRAACTAAGFPQTDADLYVRTSSEINAFAVGRRTICVTSKALSELVARRITDDQFTALLLHEIGHLRHGDTRFGLPLAWLSAPWRVASRIVLSVCAKIAGPQPLTLLAAVAMTAGVVAVARAAQAGDWPTVIIIATLVTCAVVVPLLDAHLGRRSEYAADRFVATCGYGAELIMLLVQLDSTAGWPSRNVIIRCHPTLARRCERIMNRAAVRWPSRAGAAPIPRSRVAGADTVALVTRRYVAMTALAIGPEPVPLVRDQAGRLMVPGTRISLDVLVADFQRGKTPESIHDAYGTVSLADVYAILAYYLRHRSDVDAYLAEQDREGAEIQAGIEAIYPADGLRAKLLARLES